MENDKRHCVHCRFNFKGVSDMIFHYLHYKSLTDFCSVTPIWYHSMDIEYIGMHKYLDKGFSGIRNLQNELAFDLLRKLCLRITNEKSVN